MTGAQSAVDCLWRDLQQPLLRYLGAFDRSNAEDLASDVWVDPPAPAQALFRTR